MRGDALGELAKEEEKRVGANGFLIYSRSSSLASESTFLRSHIRLSTEKGVVDDRERV